MALLIILKKYGAIASVGLAVYISFAHADLFDGYGFGSSGSGKDGSRLSTTDPILIMTGKSLEQHVNRVGQDLLNAPESWAHCIGDVVDCVETELEQLPYRALMPVIKGYQSYLFSQSAGRWRKLSNDFIEDFQAEFLAIDLKTVIFAPNINTIHGQAITWNNAIFFPREINYGSSVCELELMLHELQHTVQYARKGERSFLSEYIYKSAGKIIERQSFDVHDFVGPEKEAIRVARNLMKKKFGVDCETYKKRGLQVNSNGPLPPLNRNGPLPPLQSNRNQLANKISSPPGHNLYFENTCSEPVKVIVRYKEINDQWTTGGWWNVDGDESSFFLAADGARVQSNNSIFYFFAEAHNRKYVWSGDEKRKFGGQMYSMRRTQLDKNSDNAWNLQISCDNRN